MSIVIKDNTTTELETCNHDQITNHYQPQAFFENIDINNAIYFLIIGMILILSQKVPVNKITFGIVIFLFEYFLNTNKDFNLN